MGCNRIFYLHYMDCYLFFSQLKSQLQSIYKLFYNSECLFSEILLNLDDFLKRLFIHEILIW